MAAQLERDDDSNKSENEEMALPGVLTEQEFEQMVADCPDEKCLEELVLRQTNAIEVRFEYIEKNKERFEALASESSSYVQAEQDWRRCAQDSLGEEVVGDAGNPEDLRSALTEQFELDSRELDSRGEDMGNRLDEIDKELSSRLMTIENCTSSSGLTKVRDSIIQEVMG